MLATSSSSLPLFYGTSSDNVMTATVCYASEELVQDVSPDSGEYYMFVDEAFNGDPIVAHCLATGATVNPEHQ